MGPWAYLGVLWPYYPLLWPYYPLVRGRAALGMALQEDERHGTLRIGSRIIRARTRNHWMASSISSLSNAYLKGHKRIIRHLGQARTR